MLTQHATFNSVHGLCYTSNLHAGMCEKNKLRVYRKLKEVFECKKYLYGVPDMGSKLLFRFRSGTQ